jgi:hypothetical protein
MFISITLILFTMINLLSLFNINTLMELMDLISFSVVMRCNFRCLQRSLDVGNFRCLSRFVNITFFKVASGMTELYHLLPVAEEFEDTQGVIRIRISKDIQHNGQKKKSTKGQTKIYKTHI